MNLYAFNQLSQKLNELGFPKVSTRGNFKIIKGIDFEKAFREGNISFHSNGIYLQYKGKTYLGYMFIKHAWISEYNKYPKFHLVKCQVIKEFIEQGLFDQRYEWSNSRVNDIVDISTNTVYPNVVLNVCKHCLRHIDEKYRTTENFFEKLDKSNIEYDRKIEVDINGYPLGWDKISRRVKEENNYTCECCSITLKGIDRMFCHIHHQDSDKLNNHRDNLKCLCIFCHANVDDLHRKNFQSNRMKRQLDLFIKKYGDRK